MTKKYEISRMVISEAKKMGFSEPILPQIKKMLINSDAESIKGMVPRTETRTYETYTFHIVNGVVCNMRLIKKDKPFITPHHYKCVVCHDSKKVSVIEACVHCDEGAIQGSKCEFCFGKGEMNKLIPCQSCSSKQRNFFK